MTKFMKPPKNRPIMQRSFGSSSVDFLVRVWCDSDVYFQYQADMKRKVKEALDDSDINIPFPTRTLVHENSAVPLEDASKTVKTIAAE